MRNYLNVFFSGSPSGGFTAYPIEYLDRTQSSDSNSYKDVAEESTLKVNQNLTTICYIVYGIGSNTKEKRGGRSFGIWIDIEDYMPREDQYDDIYVSLKTLFNKGIVENEDVDILRKEGGRIVYTISSFSENADILDKLKELVKRIFKEDFGDKLEEIPSNYSGLFVDLIPNKASVPATNPPTPEKKSKNDSTKTNKINRLSNKIKDLELQLNSKSQEEGKYRKLFIGLLLLNFIIGISALYLTLMDRNKISTPQPIESISIESNEADPTDNSDSDFQENVIVFRNGSKDIAVINETRFLSYLSKKNTNFSNIDQFVGLMSSYLVDKSQTINDKYKGDVDALASDLREKNREDVGKVNNIIKNHNSDIGISAKTLSQELNTQSILGDNFLVYEKE